MAVVIVGAGPAGMAAAIMLAQRGWKDIVILERRPDVSSFDPSIGYTYAIEGHGLPCLEALGLMAELKRMSFHPGVAPFKMIMLGPNGIEKPIPVPAMNSYWIPRHVLCGLLETAIRKTWTGHVKLHQGVRAVDIGNASGLVTVSAVLASGDRLTFTPRLLVGADGLNSTVRAALHSWEGPGDAGRFKPILHPSPSAGLRYKVLSLGPSPQIDKATPPKRAQAGVFYLLTGVLRSNTRRFRLGLFPVLGETTSRTCIIVTVPAGHALHEAKTSDALYALFDANFPQLDARSLIPLHEAERFAASDGGRFPTPQYCAGCHWLGGVGGACRAEAVQGAVLLGDAFHAFPPDLGQGVNSALGDVHALSAALRASGDDVATALPAYEATRSPEAAALVRLVQTTFPWQNNCYPWRRSLWYLNFSYRSALNKALPGLFSPHAFAQILRRPELSYAEVERLENQSAFRANTAAVAFGAAVAAIAAAAVARLWQR